MLLTSFHFSLVFRRSMTSENELSIVNRLVEYVIESVAVLCQERYHPVSQLSLRLYAY
jgi:hypothetical protein